VQSAPVHHPFQMEMENIFNNKTIENQISYDGKRAFALYQFANIVRKRDMYHSSGHQDVKTVLQKQRNKSEFDKYGSYTVTTQRKAIVTAATFMGLRVFLSMMNGDFADRFRAYEHYLSMLVEAADPTSKKLINNLMEANAASKNIINEMARDVIEQERASAGASIAAPPEQVLERACLLLLYLR